MGYFLRRRLRPSRCDEHCDARRRTGLLQSTVSKIEKIGTCFFFFFFFFKNPRVALFDKRKLTHGRWTFAHLS